MTLRDQKDPEQFGLQPNGRYLPGRAEIKRVCAEIRSGWSAREHVKRHRWTQPLPAMLREIPMAEPTGHVID